MMYFLDAGVLHVLDLRVFRKLKIATKRFYSKRGASGRRLMSSVRTLARPQSWNDVIGLPLEMGHTWPLKSIDDKNSGSYEAAFQPTDGNQAAPPEVSVERSRVVLSPTLTLLPDCIIYKLK